MDNKIKIIKKIEFSDKYNLTFVFTSKFIAINNEIASTEISPTGIIYINNSDYYFAPLSKDYNLDEIIKEYIKHYF